MGTNRYHTYPTHVAFGGYKQSGIGRETHKMMLDHYQQTKNLLVSYAPQKLGFFQAGDRHRGRRDAGGRDSEAASEIRRLRAQHGPLMFHQSGGCCDGSSPMCYPVGEFLLGGSDVRLGDLAVDGVAEPVEVWMSAQQFEYWRHTYLTIDLMAGGGGGFSLEAPGGSAS